MFVPEKKTELFVEINEFSMFSFYKEKSAQRGKIRKCLPHFNQILPYNIRLNHENKKIDELAEIIIYLKEYCCKIIVKFC